MDIYLKVRKNVIFVKFLWTMFILRDASSIHKYLDDDNRKIFSQHLAIKYAFNYIISSEFHEKKSIS